MSALPKKILVAGFVALFNMMGGAEALAQIEQVARYERVIEPYDRDQIIIPVGEHGLAIVDDTEVYQKGHLIWNISCLNTDLEQVYTMNIPVNDKYILKGYDVFDEFLYLLFFKGDLTTKTDILLFKIDLRKGLYYGLSFKNDFEILVTHLSVLKNTMMIGGYYNNRPSFLMFDLTTGKTAVVPSFFNNKGDIINLEIDRNLDFYKILISERDLFGKHKMSFKCFNMEAELVYENSVPFKDKMKAVDGVSHISDKGEGFFVGTFGNQVNNTSQGLYFSKINAEGESNLSYVYFPVLDRFFDYMKGKKASKIKAKGQTKEGGFKTNAIVHEMQFIDNKMVVLVEVFDPEYDNNNYGHEIFVDNGEDPNAFYARRTSKYSKNPNNIYDYRSISLVVFDEKGEVQWENSLKIEEVSQKILDKIGAFHMGKDKTNILYKNEEGIVYKSILNTSESVQDSTINIAMRYESDVLDSELDEGKLDHWYENHFYVWGYQTIKNPTVEGVVRKRKVLYVNKISVQN